MSFVCRRRTRASLSFIVRPSVNLHSVAFRGGILERGFWLYVWKVSHASGTALYVGRTGDSSSAFAASPFSRLGQHLDVRATATANMLLRNLRKAGVDPFVSSFELFAVGPIFPEQPDLIAHRKHRDILGPLETALAAHFKSAGHIVLGTHPKSKPYDGKIFAKVLAHLAGKV
jgi:hypothetical protein